MERYDAETDILGCKDSSFSKSGHDHGTQVFLRRETYLYTASTAYFPADRNLKVY